MATLISKATGNFTAAGTWAVADATTLLNSETNTTATTTAWVGSASLVPGAITIDAIAAKVSSHNTTGKVAAMIGRVAIASNISIAAAAVVTTSANHGLATGEIVTIAGSNSTPLIDGNRRVTVLSATTFSVAVTTTVGGTSAFVFDPLTTITSNTLVAAPVFTTNAAHGFVAGVTAITIKGSTATPSMDGTYTVATTPTTTTFTLTGAPDATGGVSGWGAYITTATPDSLVAINATDLATVNTGSNSGWTQFKFPGNLTLTSGLNYRIVLAGSTAGNATFYRDATAGNFSRILRTTTTQAPAAADILIITGDHTAPATGTAITVTNNNTATTQFGAMEIAQDGTLTWGTSASTNYYLKLNGNLTCYAGGTYNMGTSGTPMPSTSTAKLEFICGSNVQFGFEIRSGATVNAYGNVLTYNIAKLTANASAGATSLTTDVSTGWLNGDEITLTSTSTDRLEAEAKSLTANAAGTTLTIAALTYAHGGSAVFGGQLAEIGNLNRNVQIFSSSASNNTYVNIAALATTVFNSVVFKNMGSATANKRGIDIATTGASGSESTITNCVIRDFTVTGARGIHGIMANAINYTWTNNIIVNIADVGLVDPLGFSTGGTITGNLVTFCGGACYNLGSFSSTYSDLVASGGGAGGFIITTRILTAATNLTAHSNTGIGISMSGAQTSNNPMSTFSNIVTWRNTTYGLDLGTISSTMFDTIIARGNLTANINFSAQCSNLILKNITSNGGATFTAPVGIAFNAPVYDIYVDDSTFGATTTHATGDLNIAAANPINITFRNCLLNSTTPIANAGSQIGTGKINFAKYQQTAGNHRSVRKYGIATSDTTLFNRASPSQRLTPNTLGIILSGATKKIAVASGTTAKINVFIRKSVVGDGAAYNGGEVKLMLKADPAAGISADTQLAITDSSYNGAWKVLSGTTPTITDNASIQVYIDCDGSAGWVNVDDWSVDS